MADALLNIARGLNETGSTIKPYSRVSYPIGCCWTVDIQSLAIPVRHLYFFCPLLYRQLTSTDPQAKLWRVVFSEDYARVRILNNNNEEICKEFALANC